MLGRFLFDSDLEWFLKTLNYNRTRLLQPGDYFAFRPVHMFILSLNDILFRYNLIAQGIVNSALFSATATLLFHLSKKISNSVFLAIGVTSLWAFQLAGSEILLWQHISPYILLPGFFCAALLLLNDNEAGRTKLILAGFFVFLASLTHETGGLIALSMGLFSYFYAAEGRKKYAWPFALGGMAGFAVNIIDYFFIHNIKSFTGPGDTVADISFSALFSSFLPFTGAIGVASFVPSSVSILYMENWYMIWDFLSLPNSILLIGAIFVVLIIGTTAVQSFLSLKKNGTTLLNLASIFALSLFGMLYAISEFRIFTRGLGYMPGAVYYFSLFSLSISIMVLVVIVRLNSKGLRLALSTILCLLSVWHITVLYSELKGSYPEKAMDYSIIKASRDKLLHDNSICFGGMVISSVPAQYTMWAALYQDVSCSQRSGAIPVYLTGVDGKPVLAVMNYDEGQIEYANLPKQPLKNADYAIAGVPFGHTFEVTLDKSTSPFFLMTTNTGEQFGFSIDYNLVHTIKSSGKKLINTILWNPGLLKTTYKFSFFQNRIALFANGIFIGLLEDISTADDVPMRLEIYSRTGENIKVLEALIATTPRKSDVVFEPKYVF